MGDIWDWTDVTCMLLSASIALVVTIWFWKKGLLHYVIKGGVNTTVDQRPEKTKSVVQLENLESVADVLLRTDQVLQPVTLHNKVLTGLDLEAWQKDKSLPLRAYLQEMTSKRRHLLESALTISAKELVRLMDSSYNKPKEFSEILSSCIFNFTCRIAFGTNCDFDVSWKSQVKAVVEKWPDCECTSKLPEESLKDKQDEFKSAKEKLENSFKELIKSRKQNSDDENQESYIDYFFANKCEDKSYDLLAKQLISLFLCCGESTTKYLLSALELIADNPGVQRKMQAEFVNVAPEENLITLWLQNREKVRFSEAVLKEVLRLSTPVPVFMGLSNSAPESDGAEEKIFVANLKAVLEDKSQWKQAGEFVPTRFLDDEKNEAFVPFSLGENSCPGEEFFMATCFVILSSVLRKFQLKRRQQPLISEDGEETSIRESSSVYATQRVEYEE